MTRPDWDTYFCEIAKTVALRADCSRARYGAVVVVERRIVATGYNGAPAGGRSCLAGDCPRATSQVEHNDNDYSNCLAIHAEANALMYARCDLRGGTIYIAEADGHHRMPCDMCAKLIAAAGLSNVVTPDHAARVTPMGLRRRSPTGHG